MLIPKAIQCRILAALLAGRLPADFTRDQLEEMVTYFDQPWRTYLGPLLDAQDVPEGVQRSSYINGCVAITPKEREIVDVEARRESDDLPLKELHLPDIEWLWPRWIPRGMVTLFGAMPSAGKSYVALDLAHRIIAGTTFPDGAPVGEPGTVIYVDAENAPQILNRRATAWGLDRACLYLMGPAANRLLVDLTAELDRQRLLDWTWKQRPTLIVIDSLGSVNARGENSVEDVRELFGFMHRVAGEFRCAMLVVHHLRKPGLQLPPSRGLSFHDLRGSSHMVAVGRSVIGLHWVQTGPQPDLNAPRVMSMLKTNLCLYPPAIGVRFQPCPDDPEVASVVYGEVPRGYEQLTKRQACAVWLLALLKERGPLPTREVADLSQAAGFPRYLVFEARKDLGGRVVDSRGRKQTGNGWALSRQEKEAQEKQLGEPR